MEIIVKEMILLNIKTLYLCRKISSDIKKTLTNNEDIYLYNLAVKKDQQ
jgi:hypothetical protein